MTEAMSSPKQCRNRTVSWRFIKKTGAENNNRNKGRCSMEKDVAVIGVGQSSFVRGYEGSIRELAFEAFREAMQDAGITQKNVDASVFCSAPEYDKQRSPAGVLAE